MHPGCSCPSGVGLPLPLPSALCLAYEPLLPKPGGKGLRTPPELGSGSCPPQHPHFPSPQHCLPEPCLLGPQEVDASDGERDSARPFRVMRHRLLRDQRGALKATRDSGEKPNLA